MKAPVAALVTAAFLFGSTFVVVKDAVADYPPLAFVGWRFLVGAVALLLLARPRTPGIWRDGAVAGLLLYAGYALQTAGLVTTEASTSALITGMFVVFTPLVHSAWTRRAPSPWVLVGVVLAFIGLALVTLRGGFVLGVGDLFTLGCALAFAVHIVYLARVASRYPVVPFTAVQLLVTAALGLSSSLVVESAPFPPAGSWPAILLTGLGVSALAFLLQIWAQTKVGPSTAAVVLTLEPVFGVALGVLVLAERMTLGRWVGAALIVAAIQLVVTRGNPYEATEVEAVTPAH